MTTHTAEPVEKSVRRPRASLVSLRIVLVLHAALIVAQPILAGYFLSGNVDAMNIHSPIGSSVWLVALIQFVVAAIYWLVGGGRSWPTVLTAVLFVAEFVQLVFGYQRNFAVHIPLGTAIVITVVWTTVWSFRPTARLSRREAKR
ncbi:hypothetical protein OG555_06870 [Kribbella sp. NBC_01484]|uniref:hypothetical protein n=1 Tax=Kribbella sp. NBC_01484 TaxID=2903579 RepID=UPI002E37AF34|nr:hypothetical protein [Kribbella sp. NBC_01484]